MTRTASTESQVGPGSYYYFDSNTIPRAQAKKYDFPWDSLPKDWTTSVKLRAISKRRKEDRQSSSGNWSQSGYSSNRQSVDSAKSSVPSTMSQYSLGKDSGRDSPRSAGERDGLDMGYMGDAASTESISDTKSLSNTDSDDWIRSLAEQAANRGDVTSTSAEALASLSRLTKQNIRNLDILIPGRTHLRQKRNELEDDGESDSGLKRSTNTLLDDDDEDYDLIMPRVRETKSLQSVIGYSSMRNGSVFTDSSSAVSAPDLASVSFGNLPLPNISEDDAIDVNFSEDVAGEVEYGNSGTLKAKKKQNKTKKVPPPPPPRTTSVNSSNNQTQSGSDEALNSLDDSPTSVETSSESSDHETIYARLKMKTSISAHTFPSWCVGLASDEDELQDRLHAESSEVEELFSGKDSWISGTLPRTNAVSHPNETDQATNSWPRIKRINPQQSGILKTTEKDKTKPAASNPKVLNFDPVVNLFDATSPHSVQMPLSRLSSSDESSSPNHARSLNMLSTVSSNQDKKGVIWSDDLRYPFYNSGSTESNLTSSNLSPESSDVRQSSTVSKAATGSNITQITHSDKNNNRSKDTNFVHADSLALKQEFKNQSTTHQNHSHPLELQLQPPLTGGYVRTNAPISHGNFHQLMMRSSHTDRRRSSPSVAAAAGSSSSTSNSGNEDSCEIKGSKVSDSVKRRRSDLYSPSDSGYGSPPVSSQPSSQVFTYSSSKTPQQQYSSIVHAQIHSAHVPSSSSMNTETINKNTRTSFSFASESNSRPDYPNTLRQMSNQSTESLSSQFSISSTQQLIPKIPKTDLSQPVLHRENSTESMHSNSSGARSDSYRVAMSAEGDETSLIPNKISNISNSSSINSNSINSNSSILRKTRGEHRSQLTKSLPAPVPAMYADDAVGRADSYRCAVRNTQSLLFADAYGRNSSYRLATCEEDVVITDNRMDACNLWTGKTGTTRDMRRMGITDVDQLKHYNNESDESDKSGNRRSLAKISNTVHAKKKLSAQTETEGLINPPKSSSSEHKRFMRPSSKDKAKQKTQSSTYIRFDPIFESGEDLRASNESLRPPSIVSIRTLTQVDSSETVTSENTSLIRGKVASASPPRKRSSSQGRRDDKSSLSIFGSIKTTIRSIGGTKGD
ncbi:unnamed protein product [Candidula unifasciata]|uniref:Uncharacterized protein n=1 Tax=Candidula unifasciata TaxID=100452 RepID=A0A8S3YXM3_9EUPU|nr:unnamed protein product [Candidula unifasciata]